MLHDSGVPAFRFAGVAQARAAEIRDELAAVLGSSTFARAERASNLLKFLVEAVVAGRAKALSEYVLAAEVFDKPDSFDPSTDAIVRTEMGRLRKKLQEYYGSEGRSDTTVISLPVRSYCPVFSFAVKPPEIRRPHFVQSLDWRVAAVALVAIAVFATAYWGIGQFTNPARAASASARSLIVLPFSVLNPQPGEEYIPDGITDELIQELSRLKGVSVLSRTTAFSLKGLNGDIREVGRRVNATMALEGTVVTTAKSIRISARLFSTSDGYGIWSRTFERERGEEALVARLLAVSIAEALRDKLSAPPARMAQPHIPSADAYHLYLQGRAATRQFTPTATLAGIRYFEEATAVDPRYAPSFGELAEDYALAGLYGWMVPGAVLGKAKAAATAALNLDPEQPSAHAALGIVNGIRDWNWSAAEKEFKTAIELDPNDTFAREAYALGYLSPLGQWQAALDQLAQAEALDPLSPRIPTAAGIVHYFRRDHDAAIKSFQRALNIDRGFAPAHLALGAVYEARGQFGQAIAEFQAGRDNWTAAASDVFLAHTYALSGRRADAQKLLDALLARRKDGEHVMAPSLAAVYIALGSPDQAIGWLEEGQKDHCSGLVFANVNPQLDPLRAHARFAPLMRAMGLL